LLNHKEHFSKKLNFLHKNTKAALCYARRQQVEKSNQKNFSIHKKLCLQANDYPKHFGYTSFAQTIEFKLETEIIRYSTEYA
jgi:hypothetical protein